MRQIILAFLILFAVYTDITRREIPDFLTKPVIFIFTVYWLLTSNFSALCVVGATFLVSYFLYRLGLWAGGDVKLFTAVSALMPGFLQVYGVEIPFVFVLILLSMFLCFIFAVVFMLFCVLREKSTRTPFLKELFKAFITAVSFSFLYPVFGSYCIPVLFLPVSFICVLGVAVFFVYRLVDFASLGVFFMLSLFFILLKYRVFIFVRKKSVDSLREGDVPGEFVTPEGDRIQVTLMSTLRFFSGRMKSITNPFRAGGLTEKEIQKLKRVTVEIYVKETLPFVPFLFISYLVLLVACGGLLDFSLCSFSRLP